MKRDLAKKLCLLFCLALSLALLSGFGYGAGLSALDPGGRYDAKAMRTQEMSPSDEGVKFFPEKVVLRKGETEISGYFLNEGDSVVRFRECAITFTITTGNKQIWADKAEFSNADITLRPGEKTTHTFVVVNPDAPAYDGPFKFDCKVKYWTAAE